MLGVDALDLVVMVTESEMVKAAANDLLGRSQVLMLPNKHGMRSSVKRHVRKWCNRVTQRITQVGETEAFQKELALYQTVIYWREEEFFDNIDDVIQQLEWHSAFYIPARQLLENNKGVNNPMFPHYFCDQWYQSLSQAIQQAQLLELEESKEKLLQELYQRMETMKQIDEVTELENEQGLGRLWDMSAARLSKTDLTTMRRYAEFLKKNQGLREIAEQLGRMANDSDEANPQHASVSEWQMMEEKSDQATDDIVGVHESDDLNKMLPNEALFLAHPELEVLFYQHLVDKRLLNYRMQGKNHRLRQVKAYHPNHAETEVEKGPFIICVDASGSMNGFPEQCAKAIAYALMQIALAEDRDCFVILFSTELITYELTRQDGLREAGNFLSYTFHGGTDFEPVIAQCVQLMQSEKYRNADLVAVSDFIAPKQTEEMLEQVAELKAQRNRFHAVTLSKYGNPALLSLFDHCWHYHPSTMGRLMKKSTI